MSCCSPYGHGEFFDERMARREAGRYRRRGLDAASRRVVDFLRGQGLYRATVLEIGGGVGAIQLELLRLGAVGAVNVELSPAYEAHAAALAREANLADRVDRRLFDFAERPDEVEPADFVVLHRVVCCYPDYRSLVAAAAVRARRALVLTFPRDEWWTRVGFAAFNAVERLRGHTFRSYLHPPAAVLAVARDQGFRSAAGKRDAVWLFEALVRA